MEAPLPKWINCENCPDRPSFYGKEYHGVMGHKEATLLLENEPNGAFLIRKGNNNNDFYTLTWRYWKYSCIIAYKSTIYTEGLLSHAFL